MRNQNDFHRVCRIAMLMALPLGVAACAPDEGEQLDETPETTLPEEDVSEAMEPITVDLEGEDVEGVASEVQGEATITRMQDSLMVSLSLENLPGEGPFQAHIHAGSCEARPDEGQAATPETPSPTETGDSALQEGATSAEQGRVLVPLEPVTVGGMAGTGAPETPPATTPGTEAEGQEMGQMGMSTTTVAISQLQGQQEAFIQVHDQGQPIACGNIEDLSRATMGSSLDATPSDAPGTTPGAQPGTGSTPPGGSR